MHGLVFTPAITKGHGIDVSIAITITAAIRPIVNVVTINNKNMKIVKENFPAIWDEGFSQLIGSRLIPVWTLLSKRVLIGLWVLFAAVGVSTAQMPKEAHETEGAVV